MSSAQTSDAFERLARLVFRPLCGSLAVFVLLHTADADQSRPDLYDVAKWTTVALFVAGGLLGVGAVVTDPKGSRS